MRVVFEVKKVCLEAVYDLLFAVVIMRVALSD
jgi:hypothetical protein